MQIRPMRRADVVDAERLSGEAFHRLDIRRRPADDPEPDVRSPEQRLVWRERALHLLEHDGNGCWIAEEDGEMLGAALSLRRETLWGLSSLAVRHDVQHRGVGGKLLEAALTYSQGCVRGMICSSQDPGAVRRYHQSGFTIHPTMQASGRVDRTVLPVIEDVRTGAPGDLDLLESVDRRTRGAGHGVDHGFLARHHPLLVADNHLGSGYCYLSAEGTAEGGTYLLAATSERLGQRLVWEAMARSTAETFTVGDITSEQDWLVDVVMQARLSLRLDAYVAVRFMKPPVPYVPSPHFL